MVDPGSSFAAGGIPNPALPAAAPRLEARHAFLQFRHHGSSLDTKMGSHGSGKEEHLITLKSPSTVVEQYIPGEYAQVAQRCAKVANLGFRFWIITWECDS